MTTATFSSLFTALQENERLRTHAAVAGKLVELARLVAEQTGEAHPPTDVEIRATCGQLRDLGYEPTVGQVAKVFLGSRATADDRLRGLPAFRRYRGQLTKAKMAERIAAFQREWPAVLSPDGKRRRAAAAKPAWREVNFFATSPFDKLEEGKLSDLRRELSALGMRKTSERLPAYMLRARTRLPRAFEPWTREERALLIEAMCYTNDAQKLADLFGRSVASVTGEGQRLIWESQQARKEAG